MTNKAFSVAKEFSLSPGPRYARQGSHSGETLRRLLSRRLKQFEGRLVINLDGTRGYGSSFLDEAFGGLIRSEGYSQEELAERLTFVSIGDPSYVDEIIEAMSKAKPESVVGK